MRFSTVIALAAAGVATADNAAPLSTQTITSTMTRTLTLTKCNSGYTGCPVKTTSTPTTSAVVVSSSSKPHWSVNSTVTVCPTGTGSYSKSTLLPITTPSSSVVAGTTSPVVTKPPTPTAAAPGARFTQAGLLVAAFAAAIAVAY